MHPLRCGTVLELVFDWPWPCLRFTILRLGAEVLLQSDAGTESTIPFERLRGVLQTGACRVIEAAA